MNGNNAIIELLREACCCALKRDMRGYDRRVQKADAAIERDSSDHKSALRGEYLIATAFNCGRYPSEMYALYRNALALIGGRSTLLSSGSHLFADSYNVFAICNIDPGHADANADILSKLVPVFYALSGGGMGTDICYRSQLAYYRGNIEEALPLAKKAFDTAIANRQGLVALCAAETLTGIAKHRLDSNLWHSYSTYLSAVADGNEGADRACQEQAMLLRCMQDLSLGLLYNVPMHIRSGDLGIISAPWGWEQKESKLLTGSITNALLVQLEYASYSGNPVKALLVADIMQSVYGMGDVILSAYLDFFRAGCYMQLSDVERMREALENAVKLLSPDGLWLIAAEFAPAFGDILYDVTSNIDAYGARRIREIGTDYWHKLIPFRDEILHKTSVGLTKREKEISMLILNGSTNAEIAEELSISERTVKGHVTGIFRKYNISHRSQLTNAMLESPEAHIANWMQ